MEGNAVEIGYNLVDGDWRSPGSLSVRFCNTLGVEIPGKALGEEGLN